VLDPILFCTYINAVFELNVFPNQKITTQLFADDLFAFNIDKNIRRLVVQMNRYLKSLETFCNKWRFSIASNKCSFTIYSPKLPKEISSGQLKLVIFGQPIPVNNNPKYLGVILDRKVNFNKHIEEVRTSCIRKLNILKCLSYKKWSLGSQQQLVIYKSLIRSCMEYAAPVIVTNQHNVERLHGIQYKALKIISKNKSLYCSNQFLHDLFQIQSISNRLHELASNYFESAILKKNPIIIELLNDITFSSGRKTNPLEASLSITR